MIEFQFIYLLLTGISHDTYIDFIQYSFVFLCLNRNSKGISYEFSAYIQISNTINDINPLPTAFIRNIFNTK